MGIWLVGELPQQALEDRQRDTIRSGKGPVSSFCSPLVEQEAAKSYGMPSHGDRREMQIARDVQREKQTSHDVRRVKQIADVGRGRRWVVLGDRPSRKPPVRRRRS